MNVVFYAAAAVAIISTLLVITRRDAVHALLYLVVSLLSVSLMFFVLGAPFAAALEAIVYAGAIMVLFIFIVMMLNLGRETREQEIRWLEGGVWRGPAVLALILLIELAYAVRESAHWTPTAMVDPRQVGIALYGPYLIAVELASILLLAGLVGAYHLARRRTPKTEKQES